MQSSKELSCGSQLDQEILNSLCEYYDLPPIKKIKINTRGLVNSTFESQEFFITLFRNKTPEQIAGIATIANNVSDIPLAKPLEGKRGYVYGVNNFPTLVTKRFKGIHFVGQCHSNKHLIPIQAHRAVAKIFWELHRQLPTTPQSGICTKDTQKEYDEIETPDEISSLDNLSELIQIVSNQEQCALKYPRVIHGDMERQNILFSEKLKVSGIVDLDAIKNGDLLFEFAHFLFNFVCCDPNPTFAKMNIYLEQAIIAGMIDSNDLSKIYSYICTFSYIDIISYLELTQIHHMDIQGLVSQYKLAILFSLNYFKNEFSS